VAAILAVKVLSAGADREAYCFEARQLSLDVTVRSSLMITASKLAGFFAAHAIWCVSDAETLIPMLAYTTEDDERKMERLVVNDDLEPSVAFGKEKLQLNEMNASDAVLLYDGRIPIGLERVDAIIIEMRAYFSPGSEAIMPYRTRPRRPVDFGSTSQSFSRGRIAGTST
jgi:hypothetical protein